MAYQCDLCGKGKLFGKDQTHRHGGMWALRGPNSSKHWRPNLRTVRVEVNGRMRKMRLCVSCLRKKVKQTVESK